MVDAKMLAPVVPLLVQEHVRAVVVELVNGVANNLLVLRCIICDRILPLYLNNIFRIWINI